MKFIELTESYTNDRTERLILNVNHIISFKISDKGNDTRIVVSEGKYFFVRETVQVIYDILNMKDC